MIGAGRSRKAVIHTATEIVGIRRAAQAAARVRDELRRLVAPGMTTEEVDRVGGEIIRREGGTSAFLNYRGYPARICISLNDEVVHGIARADRVIQVGDLVSLDIGVRLGGFIGDTAATVCVGAPRRAEALPLIAVAEQSLAAGIAAARGGGHVSDIGVAVERVVRQAGFSVVHQYVGHGCGCELHEPPEVPNFDTGRTLERLVPGMVLAIEPMVNTGSADVTLDPDGWTVRTADGGLSAHVEHMVLITAGEPEILTWPKTASA